MIYSYSKHNFFGGTFFLGQTNLKLINGRIDNEMTVFFKSVPSSRILRTNRKKNIQLEPLVKKYFDLIEELAVKVMSSSFLRSTFGLTQTKKSCNGRMEYHEF